jgi:DnaJ-class molecular chaperone
MDKKIFINETKRTCQHCGGTGEVERDNSVSCPKIYKKTQCVRCKGKGYYIDKHYIVSDGKIAFDCDTLK